MRSQIISALILISALLTTNVLGDYIIDQHWEEPESPHGFYSFSILNTAPLGQEFTAGADCITAAEIFISNPFAPPPGELASITVKIHESTITGSVLASSTVTLETPPYESWWYFDFGEEVPITHSNPYVIDVSMSEGSVYWSWDSWEDSDGIGVPGRMIVGGGYHDPGGEETDYAFGFRTYTIPEPATLLLFGFGCLILRGRRRV